MSKRGKRHHKTSRLDPELLEEHYGGGSQADIDVLDEDSAEVPRRDVNQRVNERQDALLDR